jgi:DNA invertase Pin-like site-specific DNA recombinase
LTKIFYLLGINLCHLFNKNQIDKLTFHISCTLAEFGRKLVPHRVNERLQAAGARKKVLRRPKGLNKAALQKATTAAALYKEGTLNVLDICEQLNISISTLYRYLKHQTSCERDKIEWEFE